LARPEGSAQAIKSFALPIELIFILEQLLNGLLVGVYYLLIALGLSLIFSLSGIVNLAHGGFYAIGAYVMVTVANQLGYPAALVISPLAVALIGVAVERVFFRKFYRLDPALSLLLTFGLAMVIEQLLRMIFGATPRPFAIPDFLRGQILIGEFIYSRYRFAIFAVAVAAVVGLWFLLQRTPFGRIVRAGIQDPDMVGALGISLKPYLTAVAALGIGLAGLAGGIMAPITGVHPAMGSEILIAAFVIVVIGGLGSFWGVVLAAILVGAVRGLTVYFFPPAAEISMYLLMFLVLLLRPRGLFGERIARLE
jgi:branched-chain amino acid transport system permease protein